MAGNAQMNGQVRPTFQKSCPRPMVPRTRFHSEMSDLTVDGMVSLGWSDFKFASFALELCFTERILPWR